MKFFPRLLLLLISLNFFSQTPTQPDGKGTSSEPYLMSSLNNLYWLAKGTAENDDFSKEKYFLQTNNIDASETNAWPNKWLPIGGRNSVDYLDTSYSADTKRAFQGYYNGGGYTIDGIEIENNTYSGLKYNGFFGRLHTPGYVINLHLTNINLSTISDLTGGLVAYVSGNSLIYNCSASGTISSTNNNVGGLIGFNQGFLLSSYSTCNVTGNNNVGVLLGSNQRDVYNNFSKGASSGSSNVGGLLGYNNQKSVSGNISNSTAIATNGTNGGMFGVYSQNLEVRTDKKNYWNKSLNENGNNNGGIGLDTDEFKSPSSYDSDFIDFTHKWSFGADGFPVLVNPQNTWLGVNDKWEDRINWSLQDAPNQNSLATDKNRVLIPADLNNYPNLTKNIASFSITIEEDSVASNVMKNFIFLYLQQKDVQRSLFS